MNRNSNIAAANDTISIDTIPDSILKPRYECNNKGVFWIGVKTGKDGEVTEAEPLRLADTIKAVGYGIDANNDYYRVIQFRDLSSRQIKTVALSMGEIGSDAFWYRLQILGLFISSEKFKQKKLADYLKNLKEYGSKTPYHITAKAGWHGNAYILPSGEVMQNVMQNDTSNHDTQVIYNGSLAYKHAYQPSGTLEEWQQNIAQYAQGNSRLMLAIGASLAAPFLPLLHLDGGGFHLHDNSSSGKTTSSNVAQSVWCIGGKKGRLTWDNTTNSMEKRALARNNNLVVPDEVGEAKNAKDVAQTCYKLANGNIRGRLDRYAQDAPQQNYDVLVFSTGEHSLAEFVTDNGGKWNAGQDVRIVSIKAKVSAYGVFDTIHHFPTSKAFVDHLNTVTMQYYGTAGRALIELIMQDKDAAIHAMKQYQPEFMQSLPNTLGNQAQRVAQRFALVAAALAFAQPITTISKEDAFSALTQCFNDWLTGAGAEDYEKRKAIEQAIHWFDQNGASQRFYNVGNSKVRPIDFIQPLNFAGYRQHQQGSSGIETDLFMVTPTAFKEMTHGLGERRAAEIYTEIGWLRPPTKDGRLTHKALDTGTRCYFFNGMYPPNE